MMYVLNRNDGLFGLLKIMGYISQKKPDVSALALSQLPAKVLNMGLQILHGLAHRHALRGCGADSRVLNKDELGGVYDC